MAKDPLGMPLFVVVRQFLTLLGFSLILVAQPTYAQTCEGMLATEFDPALKGLVSQDARFFKGDGFYFMRDSTCSNCLYNLRVTDPKAATQSLVHLFHEDKQSALIRAELPLIFALAQKLRANVNIRQYVNENVDDMHPNETYLNVSLDFNAGENVRITQASDLFRLGNYQRLEINFHDHEIRLRHAVTRGMSVGGRTMISDDRTGNGMGLSIQRSEDGKRVIVDLLQNRLKFYVGDKAPPIIRLMVEVARQLGWQESPTVESVTLVGRDGELPTERTRHLQ